MSKLAIAVGVTVLVTLSVPILLVRGGVAARLRGNASDSEHVQKESDREHGRDLKREHDGDDERDIRPRPETERDRDAHHDRGRDDDGDRETGLFFGKTVKLEFKLLNDEEQPTFYVLCAAGEFEIDHDISEPNGSHQIGFGGEMEALDDDGRLAMHYEIKLRHANPNENVEGTFQIRGSAVLQIGKVKKLGVLGDTVVQVTATWDD